MLRLGPAARWLSLAGLAGERWRLDSAPTFCLYSSVESEARWGMGGAGEAGEGAAATWRGLESSAAAVAAPAAACLASRESLRQRHETRGACLVFLVLALSPLLSCTPALLLTFVFLRFLCLINIITRGKQCSVLVQQRVTSTLSLSLN